MRRRLLLAFLSLTMIVVGAKAALADPIADLTGSRPVELSCESRTLEAITLEGSFFVEESTSIFVVTELSAEELGLLFSYPGLAKSALELVTCTFVGPRTGLHFTAVGFFTPASG